MEKVHLSQLGSQAIHLVSMSGNRKRQPRMVVQFGGVDDTFPQISGTLIQMRELAAQFAALGIGSDLSPIEQWTTVELGGPPVEVRGFSDQFRGVGYQLGAITAGVEEATRPHVEPHALSASANSIGA